MRVFLIRHQAAGILDGIVLLTRPTDAELADVARALEHRFGAAHPHTGAAWWVSVEEHETLDSVSDVIRLVGPRTQSEVSNAVLRAVSAATGAVQNP